MCAASSENISERGMVLHEKILPPQEKFFLACQVLFEISFNGPIKTVNLGRLGAAGAER